MVQSSDLVRISTVQSADFTGQSSDLAQGIYFIKSLSDLRSSSTLSGCQFDGENHDCLLHNLCSSDRLGLADGSEISQNVILLIFYSIHLVHYIHHIYHEILHVFEVIHGILEFPSKSSDFLKNFLDIPG